jgi:hypothetical protein
MRKIMLLVAGMFCLPLFTNAQQVTVHSFQHVIRWVNENNLPRYIAEKEIQDSILDFTGGALKGLFMAESVKTPDQISVKFIEIMGKGKIEVPPAPASPDDISVNLLSFVTRGTTNFAVLWNMEIIAVQGGKVIYQKKKEHEIEYFSASGYMTPISWYTPEQYISLYKKLMNELLTARKDRDRNPRGA